MKLIIGLGNPGEKYKNNRHNVGYMVIDQLKSQKLKFKNIIFKKTDVFMNDSGTFVKKLFDSYSSTHLTTNDLYIVHDDLDLPLGTWKIQLAKGPKDHGGINDIEQELGTKSFTRIRVGVDNRKPETKVSGEEYVLQDFSPEENKILDGVIGEILEKLLSGIN